MAGGWPARYDLLWRREKTESENRTRVLYTYKKVLSKNRWLLRMAGGWPAVMNYYGEEKKRRCRSLLVDNGRHPRLTTEETNGRLSKRQQKVHKLSLRICWYT